MTDATPLPPALPDMQDPLPESNWFWRRVFTGFALILIFGILVGLGYAVHRIVGGVIERIDGMSAQAVADITIRALAVIEQMFRYMFWALLTVITYYMIAPSAEQIAKMISAVSLLKGGVKMATRTKKDEAGTETATVAGKPDVPVAPIVPGPTAPLPPTEATSKPTEILE